MLFRSLINHGEEAIFIDYGDRIAQLIIQRVELPELEIVDSLDTALRGAGGFGSTGVN